ncbi:DUF7221 family queuine tRNA-ribosyltransferase-like protein [Sphingobium sp.]|uniref:deazapurine DNA modification protein DpdA family protein n=1 Tax=Sphingobium sp. TaxID=1912891 RepID=UPI003BB506F0
MAIEIMVGLPHLREGPILNRARAMQVPTLISANALSRWNRAKGWPEWQGWRLDLLKNADGLHSLALDSAGFVAMSHYRAYPWRVDDYLDLAASYPFHWFASMDYCVEPEIAPNRDEVRDRISRTIRVNRDCWRGAHDRGIAHRFMPVIQGRAATDYEYCIDALGDIVDAVPLIGIGSMCRRPVGGADGVIAIFEHLDRILEPGTMLHGFGIKGTALSKLCGLDHRIQAVDSQAFGIASRIEARQRGISKTDAFVADHMENWARRQYARSASAMPPIQGELALAPDECPPHDPWERAIVQARAEIRELIEEGQLAHDEIAQPWIEQWAADIFQAPPPLPAGVSR